MKVILAQDSNGLIGKGNELPWKHSGDMKHFRETTTGQTVIMGYNTYKSIGKPLPNRRNIVISRESIDGVETVEKLNDEDGYLIGGYKTIKDNLDKIDEVILTTIHETYEGDLYLGDLFKDFEEIGSIEYSGINEPDYTVTYLVKR